MTTKNDLLEVLVSSNVLTSEQVSLIQERDSDHDQIRKLLREITRKTIPNEKRKRL